VALLIGLPVLYVASFGPICWTASRLNVGETTLPTIYRPVTWMMLRDEQAAAAMSWYARLGSTGSWHWTGFSDAGNGTVFWTDEVIFAGQPTTCDPP
jgi:hypothetical protein